jgi:UDP-3-O-[3-hydroxymyristoyl] N-acetylglucosamine deacetylase/3-hydroxyacyl-[acyl-carrier-protein] dehydratase
MDGSSKYFVEALEKAGIEEQNTKRNIYVVKEIISFTDEESGSEILIMPNDSYCVTTMVDFGTKILGTQNATMKGFEFKKKNLNPEHLVSYMN